MSDQLTIEDFLTTRSDIITFAVVIAAIIIVFVLLFFLLRFFERKKVRTVFHEKFEELIGEMSRFTGVIAKKQEKGKSIAEARFKHLL